MGTFKIRPLDKFKAIIIDHDHMIGQVYNEVLQENGYESMIAPDVANLLDTIAQGFMPDIIISDEIFLNDENKLAETLRLNNYRGLIIMFTASDFETNEQNQFIDVFISKLGGPEELLLVMKLSLIQQAIKRMPRVSAN